MTFTTPKLLLILLLAALFTSLHAQISDTVYFCNGANDQMSTAPSGVIYDRNGENANYNNYESCSLLINPGCATIQLFLIIDYLQSESCCDRLIVYDGESETSGILVGIFSGALLDVPITSTSGKFFIRWYTDGSATFEGFRLRWLTQLSPQQAPVGAASVSDNHPALNQWVQFEASATNSPLQWNWNFGDGQSSNVQNPQHRYSVPGDYTATLVVTNCYNLKDTVYQSLTVQEAPDMTVTPTSLSLTTTCGAPATGAIQIVNNGPGDLLFNTVGTPGGKKKVVVYSFIPNQSSFQGINNLLSFYSQDVEMSQTNASDSASLALALKEQDILIFPELWTGIDVWQLMSLRGALDDFIEQGGSIIISGAYNYNIVHSAFNFLVPSSAYAANASSLEVTLVGGHPITDGLPGQIVAPYYAGAHFFNSPEYVSLCNVPGGSLLGYRAYNKGNVVYVGFNFENYNFQLGTLLINTINWCGKRSSIVTTPEEGIVAPGDTVEIQIEFPTSGLFVGTYTGAVEVTSNENFPNTVVVPLTVTVTGQAEMALSPAVIDFDTIMQLGTATRSFILSNSGCDSLRISGISTDVAGVTWDWPNQVSVPPYSSDTISMTFHPQDTGAYTGLVAFQTNVGAYTFPLNGYATGVPFAEFIPDSLAFSLNCGDSIDISINLANTGLGPLMLEREGSNVRPRILILDNFSYYYVAGLRIQNWLQLAYPEATFAHIQNTMEASTVQAAFDSADLVIMPAFYSLNNVASSPQIRDIFRSYLERGGSVIFSGSPYLGYLDLPELLSANANYSSLFIPQLETNQPEHPLFDNVELSGNTYDNIWGVGITNTDYVPLVRYQGLDVLGYRQNGLGKIIYIGHKYEYEEEQPLRLLLAAVKWSLSPAWLTITPEDAVVAAGDTVALTVHLNTTRQPAGTYYQSLRFRTNHPQYRTVTLPVSLQITGTPQLNIPNLAYNFGVIQQNAQRTLPVLIENNGCDSLHLISANSSLPAFSITSLPAVIAPFGMLSVPVKFSSTEIGLHTGTITFETDGGTQQIQLSGITVGAPSVTYSPVPLQDTVQCDQVQYQSVTLGNSGPGVLNYQIGFSQKPLQMAILLFGANADRFSHVDYYLQQVFNTAVRHNISNANPTAFADSLALSDVLIIPPLSADNPAAYAALAAPIQQFLTRGGIVLMAGVENKAPLVQMGLISNTVTFTEQYYPGLQKKAPNHTIIQNLPTTQFTIENQHFIADLGSNSGFRTLIASTGNNESYLALRAVNNGMVVWWGHGFTYYSSYTYTSDIFNGLKEWFVNPLPSGVSTNTVVNGNVPPGGSQSVQLAFNADQIPGGVYSGLLKVFTDDPLHPTITVPVSLTASYVPCADFTFEVTDCTGQATFSDTSVNLPTSWYWQFGDGAQSFDAEPTHTYTNAGNYTVTLVGCNNFGCDTATHSVMIPATNGPLEPLCMPQANGQCCDSGIKWVRLANLDYTSGSGETEEDYIDRSCSLGTELQVGHQYPLQINTSTLSYQYVRAWIDFNNNGDFSLNEQVLSSYNYPGHFGNIVAPVSAVKDTPLRLRIMADVNTYPEPCVNLGYGQTEDYYVILRTGPVSASEESDDTRFRIMPNPTSGTSVLELGENKGPLSVKIVHQAGGQVFDRSDITDEQITLPAQSPGVYWIQIRSGERVSVKKWVVVR